MSDPDVTQIAQRVRSLPSSLNDPTTGRLPSSLAGLQSGSPELPLSAQGVMSPDAASVEYRQAVVGAGQLAERTILLYGHAERSIAQTVEQTEVLVRRSAQLARQINETFERVAERIEEVPERQARNQEQADRTRALNVQRAEESREREQEQWQSARRQAPQAFRPAEESLTEMRQDVQQTTPQPPTPQVQQVAADQAFAEGRAALGGGGGPITLSGVRQRAGEVVANYLSQRDMPMDDVSEILPGVWARGATEDAGLGDLQILGDEEVAGLQEQQRRSGITRGFVGSLATGATPARAVLAQLPLGAVRAAGVAGAGLAAAQGLGTFAEQQREQNLRFQQVMGVSNTQGFVERGRENLFGFSQFGVMDDQRAQQVYGGAMRAGFTGASEREAALDFAAEQFTRNGLSVEQTLQAMSIAANQGRDSFADLSRGLDAVTEAAREAGLNTQQARQNFLGMAEDASRQVSGPNATAISQVAQQALSGMGQRYEDVTFAMDERMFQQLAFEETDRTGEQVTPSMMRARIAGEGGARIAAGATQGLLQRAAATGLGEMGQQAIAQAVEEVGGMEAINEMGPDEQRAWRMRVAQDIQASGAANADVVFDTLSQQARIQGLDPADAMELAVSVQTGAMDLGREQESLERRTRPHEGEAPRGAMDRFGGLITDIVGGALPSQLGEALNLDVVRENLPFINRLPGRRERSERDAYFDLVDETQTRLPVAEELLANYDRDRRYRVETADGPREVSMIEGLTHFQDQFTSGEAMIVGEGTGSGKTVGEFTAMAMPGAESTTDEKRAPEGVGREYERPEGEIVVRPAPELRRLLEFSTSGSVRDERARRTGTPSDAWPLDRGD